MARDSAYVRLALRIFGEMSAMILLPALAAVVGSRLLAVSRPLSFILIAAAFALTSVFLVRSVRSYGRAFERLAKEPPDRV